MAKVIVINRTTKVQSTLGAEEWDRIKNDPQWRGVFDLVRVIKDPPPDPPEVVALLEASKGATQPKSRKKRKPRTGE